VLGTYALPHSLHGLGFIVFLYLSIALIVAIPRADAHALTLEIITEHSPSHAAPAVRDGGIISPHQQHALNLTFVSGGGFLSFTATALRLSLAAIASLVARLALAVSAARLVLQAFEQQLLLGDVDSY
jgi:hypothetical protein